jgi:hypothetical protein
MAAPIQLSQPASLVAKHVITRDIGAADIYVVSAIMVIGNSP